MVTRYASLPDFGMAGTYADAMQLFIVNGRKNKIKVIVQKKLGSNSANSNHNITIAKDNNNGTNS